VYLKYAGCWFSTGSCALFLTQGLWFWAVFVAIFVYDLRHKIIPDSFIFPLILIGVVYEVVFYISDGTFGGVYDLLAPFIVSIPIFFLWLISKGRWIGLGDAKLAIALGLLLGWPGVVTSIIYAVWIGAGVSLLLIAVAKIGERLNRPLKLGSKEITMKSEIAFGPFMLIGAFLVYFLGLGLPIFNIASLL
jgi:leader peptidase (prepilin peptidase)/N-methyltransferase